VLRFFRPRGIAWLSLQPDLERGNDDPARAPRSLHLVVAAIVILASCGSDAEGPENSASSSLPFNSSSASSSEPVREADTIAPTTETRAERSSTTAPLPTSFDVVYLAPDGGDDRTGDSPEQARITLGAALEVLNPGGVIVLQPGTYPPLRIVGLAGTTEAPIHIEAAAGVEFRGEGYSADAGVLIRDSEHVEIVGMRVRQALWGVYIENSHHITVRGLDVADIGQEGIRVKAGSTNVRIDSNIVADTGRRTDNGRANGEGIYVGTGSPGGVDVIDRVMIINNRVMRTTDEAIDIKRPSTNVDIIGNIVSDVVTNTSGAIVIHLNGDQDGNPNINIERNVIRNVTRSSPHRDGNCIVSQVEIRIVNNVLHNCQHRGIFLRGSGGIASVLHNTFLNAGEIGSVVSEGRGMQVASRNNLGTGGEENRQAAGDVYVAADRGNYRLTDDAASELSSAPSVGVVDDLNGDARPTDGPVTFGAVERDHGDDSDS